MSQNQTTASAAPAAVIAKGIANPKGEGKGSKPQTPAGPPARSVRFVGCVRLLRSKAAKASRKSAKIERLTDDGYRSAFFQVSEDLADTSFTTVSIADAHGVRATVSPTALVRAIVAGDKHAMGVDLDTVTAI